MEEPPELIGGVLRFNIRRIPPFVKRTRSRAPCRKPKPSRPPSRSAPSAPTRARNYEKLVSAAREAFAEDGGSASLEDIARRAQRRHRHALPALPDAPAPARGRLSRRGRGASAARPTASPTSSLGTRSSRGCASSSASRPPSARSPRRCSARSARDARGLPDLPRAIASAGDGAAASARRRPGSSARDANFIDVARLLGGIASIRAPIPTQIERILDIVLDGLRAQPAGS